jgi:D-erythritol 1-phosphate dehydrogenase
MQLDLVDLLVVGGGINGAGIARDAAGRGLSVILCEKDDLAQGTSSRSGKLVHGGLRYLEYYEFRLVREALIEREVLLQAAPHIIWPMRFVLPHSREQRPAWLIRLGLLLYDHLGGRKLLPKSRRLDLHRDPAGKALKPEFRTGFEYSDCWVDDARLVVLNALDADARGAMILPRTALVTARREDGVWRADLRNSEGCSIRVLARGIVNAAGPWVEQVITRHVGLNASHRVRLVKGSHIVVPKFWDGSQAYLFQNDDRRVIFVNPYQGDLCLIGTTDVPYNGEADGITAGEEEILYLLRAVNRFCVRQLSRADVIHSFSGVRPLFDDNAEDPSAVTRDYVFELNDADGALPLLSVFGGKITTFRKLSEHALDRLKPYFPAMSRPWTAGAALPGGDIAEVDFDAFAARLRLDHAALPEDVVDHYARLYGTRARGLLDGAQMRADLGRHFGGALYQREAEFLRHEEWASTADDILERRTKHGLHLTPEQKQAFTGWFGNTSKSA